MSEDNIILEHVQVDAHGKISGKVKNEQSSEYEFLTKEMNQHYCNDQMVSTIQYTPSVGEMCAGSCNNQWYRVVIKNKLTARNGTIAVCYFVDEGFDVNIPVSGLRHLSQKYCELPHQVKQIHLHGIQPYTMKISPEDIHVKYGTSNIWDESAVKFMCDMVTACTQVRCSVMYSFSDGSLSVRMFLRTHTGGLSCLNEIMVKLGYAVDINSPKAIKFGTEEQQTQGASAADETALIQKIFRKHKKPHRNHGSSSIDATGTRSDSEFYRYSADRVNTTEAGHETDDVGISAISHRRFQMPLMKSSPSAPKTLTEMMRQTELREHQASTRDVIHSRLKSGYMNDHGDSGENNIGYTLVKDQPSPIQSVTPEKNSLPLADISRKKSLPLGSFNSDASVDLPSKGRGVLLSRLSSPKLVNKSSQGMLSSVPVSCDNSDSDVFYEINSGNKCFSGRNRSENDRNICNETLSDRLKSMSDSGSRRQSLSERIKNMNDMTSPKGSVMETHSFVNDSRRIETKDDRLRPVGGSSYSATGKMLYMTDSCTESDTGSVSWNERRRLAKTSVSSYLPHSVQSHEKVCENFVTSTDIKKEQLHRNSSSGNESSASNMVAAYIKGQAGFKTMRLPRESSDSENNSRTSILYQKKFSPSASVKNSDLNEPAVSGASCDERLVKKIPSPKKMESSASNISGTESCKMTQPRQKMKGRSCENQNGATNIISVDDGASYDITTEASTKMLSEMIGNRVLHRLQNDAKKSEADSNLLVSGFSERCHDVLVQGYRPPKPVYNVKHAKLSEHVQLSFIRSKFAEITLAQAFSWPAITRGRHVVTVAPPGSGKTLAYLCPLVSALCDLRVYHQVARNGKGPFLIILSLSWKRARGVYDEVRKVIGNRRDMKALMIHGGAQMEQKMACELVNGCEILVATPPCLTRILDACYIDLRRLCHLVVDDADQTLATFRTDIGSLLKEYDLVIKNNIKDLSCPRQILCFGAQWNSCLSAFMRSNLIDPILIVTSLFEASIYGQVKQVPHMCQPHERMRTMLGILENIPDDSNHPIIVFSSVKKNIVQLYKTLQSQSRACLIVHEDMDHFEVRKVSEQWPVPVLVCWDGYTAELGITDAVTVIHYDLPNSKTKFGNRLGCMRKYFYDFSKKEQSKIKPTAHLLITPDCDKQLRSLTSLLSRVECEKPEKFKAFLDGALEQRDENDNLELCTQTMAFGICRSGFRCGMRHKIIPEVDCIGDSDWLPREGEVKVRLSFVLDASHYYVRILGVKYPGCKEYEDMSVKYADMLMNLSLWYANMKNKKRYTPDEYDVGKICGCEEDSMFHRVQIFDVERSVEDADICEGIKVQVLFVDSGSMKIVPAYKLYELPDHLSSLPFQAIEVFVCKIKPVDKDTEWTKQASMFIHDNLKELELVGNVLLRVGRVMWLDPLLLRKHLPLTNTVSHQFYIHEELVRHGYADKNPDHLKRLYKLCEGKVDIPTALLIKTKHGRLLDTDMLPATRTSHHVHVSSVSTPDLFFVQRSEKNHELETMMTEIGLYIEQNDVYTDIGIELKVGSFCLAQYTNFDQRWYRAQVMKIEDEEFEIFFADYGDSDRVPKDRVRELPVDKFYELPLQAIECKLADIEPIDGDWTERSGDIIWDLTHYVNSDLRDMTAVVKHKEPGKFAGKQKTVIELSTSSRSLSLNIAHELSWKRLARLAEGCSIEPLFSHPVRSKMKFYPTLMNKIPNLCAALYYETDESKALKTAEEILSILTRCVTNMSDTTMKSAEECVVCLVKLIGRVQSTDVHEVILNCCICLIQSDERLCDLFVHENIIPSISRCLEMNCDVVLQQQAAMFIAQCCNRSMRLKAYFLKNDKLQLLLELLGSTDDDQVQGMVCRALSTLCTGCESVFDYLMSKSICTKLQKCLTQTCDHVVAEGVLMLISALAEHDSGCEDLKKESLIEAIVNNLSKLNCDKCIQYSVQQCDYFASTRRKHKTFLLEHHMVSILTRLIQLELQPTTKQLCKDLLTSLVVKVPSEPMAGMALRSENHDMIDSSSNSGVPPDVKWVQNTFRVVLKITVNGVQGQPKDIVSFTENSVSFRATVDDVCYSFNYWLFDSIIVQKCTLEIGTHVVAISMKKQKEGKWSRLLHQKVKPSNLSVDYENWVDSSSDSEVCDDEQPFLLKKKQRSNRVFKTEGVPTHKSKIQVIESDTDTSNSLDDAVDYDDDVDDNYFKL